MALIAFTNIEDGTTIDAADVNTPMNTIYDDYNGNVDGNNIKAASIANTHLSTTAGDVGGAWKSWTPTLSGQFTDADWTKTNCYYTQIGKTVICRIKLVATDSTPMAGGSGDATFTFPVTASSNYIAGQPIGSARCGDVGTAFYHSVISFSTTLIAVIELSVVSGTYPYAASVTSTAPFTWTTSDYIYGYFVYEAA